MLGLKLKRADRASNPPIKRTAATLRLAAYRKHQEAEAKLALHARHTFDIGHIAGARHPATLPLPGEMSD